MDEDWVVFCPALYQSMGEEMWTEKHEKPKEVCKKVGWTEVACEGRQAQVEANLIHMVRQIGRSVARCESV